MTTERQEPDPEEMVLRVLRSNATFKRPQAALAAFRALIALGAFDAADRGPWQRLTELARDAHPSVAAAAVQALAARARAKRQVSRQQ
jgi:hypothetical protein